MFLLTNGSYERIVFSLDLAALNNSGKLDVQVDARLPGKQSRSTFISSTLERRGLPTRTNQMGTETWTFNPAQNLVILDGFSAYAFDRSGTQASLVGTSTPTTARLPTTTVRTGTNISIMSMDMEPFYRREIK